MSRFLFLIIIPVLLGTLISTNSMNTTGQKADCINKGGIWTNSKCDYNF